MPILLAFKIHGMDSRRQWMRLLQSSLRPEMVASRLKSSNHLRKIHVVNFLTTMTRPATTSGQTAKTHVAVPNNCTPMVIGATVVQGSPETENTRINAWKKRPRYGSAAQTDVTLSTEMISWRSSTISHRYVRFGIRAFAILVSGALVLVSGACFVKPSSIQVHANTWITWGGGQVGIGSARPWLAGRWVLERNALGFHWWFDVYRVDGLWILGIPFWVFWIPGVVTAVWLIRMLRAHGPNSCPGCGYSLVGLTGPIGQRCPECGKEIATNSQAQINR